MEFVEKFDELALYIKRNRSDLQPVFCGRLKRFISELEEIKQKWKIKK